MLVHHMVVIFLWMEEVLLWVVVMLLFLALVVSLHL